MKRWQAVLVLIAVLTVMFAVYAGCIWPAYRDVNNSVHVRLRSRPASVIVKYADGTVELYRRP